MPPKETIGAQLVPYEERQEDDNDPNLGRPFRVQAKLRNNRLIKARELLGYKTTKAAADALGLNYSMLVGYEGLKETSSQPIEFVNSNKRRYATCTAIMHVAYGRMCSHGQRPGLGLRRIPQRNNSPVDVSRYPPGRRSGLLRFGCLRCNAGSLAYGCTSGDLVRSV
jgi:hypothetical protein